jgi:predicted dehydrogenase
MSVVRWGIIGAGDVVKHKSGPAILAEPRSTLAAITRRDPLDCGARIHADADALIADPEIDAIYIATPPDSHEALVMMALKAGKPIVVEKPISVDVAPARRIARAADDVGVTLSVAYYRRYDPHLIRVMSLLKAGAIGEIEAVELRQIRTDGDQNPPTGWRADRQISPGGRFSDSYAHALDWLTHAFGPPRLIAGAPARSGLVAYALQLRDAPVAGVFDPAGEIADDRLIITGERGTLTTPFFDLGPITVRRAGRGDGTIDVEMTPPLHPHLPYFTSMAAHILDGAPAPAPATGAIGATEIIRKLFAA